MHSARVAAMVVLSLSWPLTGREAGAQRVAGIGDDAITVPRGVLRVRVLGEVVTATERYRPGALVSPEPLGADFSLDTLGTAQLPALGGVETDIRAIAGIPGFKLSLGKTIMQLGHRVETMPIVAELGITSRLTAGITVPIVRTKAEAFLRANPAGNEGNVGFNPALTTTADFARDTTLVNSFARAAAQLNARLAACEGSPSSDCSSVNANRPAAQALVASSQSFASGVSRVYTQSSFVPVTNTAAQTAIESRVASFKSQYASFGVTALASAPAGPAASPARLTVTDAQLVLTDPALGIAAASLTTVERVGIGDVDVAVKVLVYDSFGARSRRSPHGLNFRVALGVALRLPTGKTDSPDIFTDIGTGDGQMDLEGRAFLDVLVGRRFWSSFVARYVNQMADERIMRITEDPTTPIVPAFRRQTVERDLGDILELEATPRWVINDFFSVAAQYAYRRKGEDSYTGTFAIPASETGYADVMLDAATLNRQTAQEEHRFGWGMGFSNLYAFERGKARIPFEVSYQHFQTTRASRGIVPKVSGDRIEVRVYTRLFGR